MCYPSAHLQTRSGKPKLIYSVISLFFFLQNGIKVYIFLILRSSRFQISNLFLATTTLGVSRQNVASGVNFEPPFWIEVITGSGSNSIPLPTFPWTTWWKKKIDFRSKLRAWQCRLTFYKMAAVTSSRWNFQKMKKTPLANRCPTSNPKWR